MDLDRVNAFLAGMAFTVCLQLAGLAVYVLVFG